MRRVPFLLFAMLLIGCSHTETAVERAAGSWSGHFETESIDGKTDPKAIAAEPMKGNLQLYVTGSKFKLDMTTPNQQYTIGGKWTAEKNRITMTADTFDFKNPTEEDQKALGLKLISPDELRTVFGHSFVLDESADKRHLTGLTVSLGRLLGRFEFDRPIPR